MASGHGNRDRDRARARGGADRGRRARRSTSVAPTSGTRAGSRARGTSRSTSCRERPNPSPRIVRSSSTAAREAAPRWRRPPSGWRAGTPTTWRAASTPGPPQAWRSIRRTARSPSRAPAPSAWPSPADPLSKASRRRAASAGRVGRRDPAGHGERGARDPGYCAHERPAALHGSAAGGRRPASGVGATAPKTAAPGTNASEPEDPQERIDGLRAWVADLDRKLGVRTYIGGALVVLALAAAGVALFLTLSLKQDAATKDDLNALRDQLSSVEQFAADGRPQGRPVARPAPDRSRDEGGQALAPIRRRPSASCR